MDKLKACSSTLLAACLLAACASTGNVISAPRVSLTNVQMTALGFSGQTFLLGFDVSNPNPFPLPINAVSYGVELDGYRFATGRTAGGFTVPAAGDSEFAITVELDLLKSAPQLLHIVRDGARQNIPYELNGELGIDIPLTRPVSFATAGEIRLQALRR